MENVAAANKGQKWIMYTFAGHVLSSLAATALQQTDRKACSPNIYS